MFLPTADLWTRLNRNYARLEETKYYPQNVFQRAREHERWPGDTEGRTLLAWVLLARATGRPPRHLAEMLALWPAEVNARGYFGKIYADGISEQQLSSHGWVLQALAELQRAAEAGHEWATPHDARALALPIIENLFLPTADAYTVYPIDPAGRETAGSYSGSHQKQIGPWILSTDVGCFTIGMTGLIDAAEAFGLLALSTPKEPAPLIEAMIARFLAIDLKAIQAQTHATLTALRGLARWSRITANPALWSEIATRYQLYTDFAWTETYANFNWFDRPRWTEPCAMVDSLIVAMELWRHTRDDRYLEHAQLIWFNALGHGFRTNGGFGCDNCPGADGDTDLIFSTEESHWCCTMRGAEGLYRMCEYQVIENTDPSTGSGQAGSLTLPFGLPGDYTSAAASLRIESTYPYSATWKLTNRGSTPLTVRLFIPHWIEGIDGSPFCSSIIPPHSSIEMAGTLIARERPCLCSTHSFNPAFPAGTIRMNGPLVLARYGEADNTWKPIFDDYLRGDMTKSRSAKKLIRVQTT
ncbi:MAG: hypothetical protein ACP5I4_10520 [Oceanipulchritudo sp.]